MIHRFVATVTSGGRELSREVAVEPLEAQGRYRVTIDGRTREIDALQVEERDSGATWSLLPAGGGRNRLVDVSAEPAREPAAPPSYTVQIDASTIPVTLEDARRALAARLQAATPRSRGPQPIRAPMPGKVVRVLCQPGDTVAAGQGVIVVEAMKMENELRAPAAGTVSAVEAREGQAVETGQILVTIA